MATIAAMMSGGMRKSQRQSPFATTQMPMVKSGENDRREID